MKYVLPFLFLPFVIHAQTANQELRFPSVPGLRLNISGFKAEISVIGGAGPEVVVKIEQTAVGQGSESQAWSVEKKQEGEAVFLRLENAQSKGAGADNRLPKVRLTVQGPGVPLDLYWKEAKVTVQDWPASAGVYLTKGEVRSSGGKGERRFFVRSGRIDLKGFEGAAVIETYRAAVAVADSKGSAEVSDFSGSVSITNYDGMMHLKSYNGKFAMEKVKGEIAFDLNQAELRTQEVEGRLTGDGKDSTLRLGYIGKANMNIKMLAGNVVIQSPKNSGSRVNVGSEEGYLDVPPTVKKTDTPNMKIGQGRLDGQMDGSIFVRSKTGAISIK